VKINRDSMAYTVVVTFAVSFVFVGILAFANEATRTRAENNALIEERRAILNAMGIAYSGDAQVLDVYAAQVQEVELGAQGAQGAQRAWRATVDGRQVEAVRFSGPALWGTVTGVIGVTPDVSQVVGLDIITQNETPGLGGRISEPWWKDQFSGEKIPKGRVDVVPGSGRGDKDPDNGRVDAVTGATLTSNSMAAMINQALASLKEAHR
jgi:Na+-transporting NADH:ubiquinone oxidoreductase subunit C